MPTNAMMPWPAPPFEETAKPTARLHAIITAHRGVKRSGFGALWFFLAIKHLPNAGY
jgi:hypothetical protein